MTGKILYKMAMDRDPMLTVFADKFLVRKFVMNKIGDHYLPKLIASASSWESLIRQKLPTNFVLKINNASGGAILVWDDAPTQNALPVKQANNIWSVYLIQPNAFKPDVVRGIAVRWLASNYYFSPGRWPEWAYKDIKPMLIIEELMLDHDGNLPRDYKFFMVHGECVFIQVDTNRFEDHRTDLYDPSWIKIEGAYTLYPQSGLEIPRPKLLEEMLGVAKALSADVDFIRVDLYETNSGVKFGELTNYPGGGMEKYTEESLDLFFGRNWRTHY